MKDIEKTSHERTREASMSTPTNQLSPGSGQFPATYPMGGGVADYSSMTPDMYAQYAYMYNYMYMQQQLALSQGMHLQQMYGNFNDQTLYQQGSAQVKSHSPKSESPQIDNVQHLRKQQRKSPKDNINHNQRYNPYSRPSSSSPSSSSLSPGINSYIKPHSSANNKNISSSAITNNSTKSGLLPDSSTQISSKLTNVNENPMDLSKKGEKLQFLSTLKSIMESKDKLSSQNNKNTKGNHCTNESTKSVVLDLRTKSESVKENSSTHDTICKPTNSTTIDSALKSQQDKLGYITVLKELLEKGHSTTSKQILSPDVEAKNEINNFTSQEHSTDVKIDTNDKVKQERTETSFDDLSVEQSLVLRNFKK